MSAFDLRRFTQIAAFAAGLMVLTWAALALTRHNGTVASVWPMDALVVALCVRWARTFAERAATVAIAGLAMAVANVLWGSTIGLALVLVLLNLVNITFATWLVRRFGSPLESTRAFVIFLAGPVVASPVLTALGACAVFAVTAPGADLFQIFIRWSFSTGLGMSIVGSFALTVGRKSAWPMDRQGLVRFVAGQGVVLVGACAILLQSAPPALFLLAPFLVIGAMSHPALGGITAVAITASVAILATVLGLGPASVAAIATVDSTLLTQVLLASMVFTVMPVSALLHRLEGYAVELESRRLKAEELNGLKTRMLAYVSHEIRSPISGVTTLAGLMRDGHMGALSPEQRQTLGQIASTGAEVDALARDLTDSAAIQSGKASVHLARVPVGEAIAKAIELARFRAALHDPLIEAPEGAAHALEVMADPLRLRQILVNLLVNGAKYGGRPPRVTITARETQGVIRFEVCDNGRGVAPEQRAALFGAFERLGQEKTDLEGAGLGLALSREMASLQNGLMGVEDAKLGGLLFWLELPLAEPVRQVGPVAA